MTQAISKPYEPPAAPNPGGSLRAAGRLVTGDVVLRLLAKGAGLFVLLMLGALVWVLFDAALPSIREFGPKFIVGTDWRPNELEVPKRDAKGKVVFEDGEVVIETIPPSFGALPVIYGTAVSSLLALVMAVPTSFGAALFLVRISSKRLSGPVSFLIEFLAAIPSLAYGIWGLYVLAPFMQHHVEPAIQKVLGNVSGFGWLFSETRMIGGTPTTVAIAPTGCDMLTGSMVLAIMILPIITAISRDVLRNVPPAQIEGSLALGATWWQSSREMLRYSRAALFGAVMLGLARAAGETMAITMVIGNNNQISASPFAKAQTMSSLLANEFAEASTKIHTAALAEVAILLLMSLLFNVVARYLVVGRGARTALAH